MCVCICVCVYVDSMYEIVFKRIVTIHSLILWCCLSNGLFVSFLHGRGTERKGTYPDRPRRDLEYVQYRASCGKQYISDYFISIHDVSVMSCHVMSARLCCLCFTEHVHAWMRSGSHRYDPGIVACYVCPYSITSTTVRTSVLSCIVL